MLDHVCSVRLWIQNSLRQRSWSQCSALRISIMVPIGYRKFRINMITSSLKMTVFGNCSIIEDISWTPDVFIQHETKNDSTRHRGPLLLLLSTALPGWTRYIFTSHYSVVLAIQGTCRCHININGICQSLFRLAVVCLTHFVGFCKKNKQTNSVVWSVGLLYLNTSASNDLNIYWGTSKHLKSNSIRKVLSK